MSSLSDRISLLRQRAADIATQLTSLGDRRRSYSLAAAEGDDHAKREIGGIDLEQAYERLSVPKANEHIRKQGPN